MKSSLALIPMLPLVAGCIKVDAIRSNDSGNSNEYFNCKIDGSYWSYKQGSFTNHDALKAQPETIPTPHYTIGGDNVVAFTQTSIGMSVLSASFPEKDTYDLAQFSAYQGATIVGPDSVNNGLDYQTDATHTGKLIFTKRTSDLLQGIFYFDAYRADQNKTVHITEGKFSIVPQN